MPNGHGYFHPEWCDDRHEKVNSRVDQIETETSRIEKQTHERMDRLENYTSKIDQRIFQLLISQVSGFTLLISGVAGVLIKLFFGD